MNASLVPPTDFDKTIVLTTQRCRSLFNEAAYLAALRRLRSPFASMTPTRHNQRTKKNHLLLRISAVMQTVSAMTRTCRPAQRPGELRVAALVSRCSVPLPALTINKRKDYKYERICCQSRCYYRKSAKNMNTRRRAHCQTESLILSVYLDLYRLVGQRSLQVGSLQAGC